MNILTLDVETTIYKYPGERRSSDRRGSPYSLNNKLVLVGLKWVDTHPYISNHINNQQQNLQFIQASVDLADIVVGHNIKYDFAWLRNIGIDLSGIKQVWDTQIAEFLFENQTNPYNSLNDACDKYGIPRKLDIIEIEYWAKCIDTDEIPYEILAEYLEADLDRTERVFLEQAKQFGIVL